jgi:cellulose biosynthesis protein BcsQ
MIFEKRNLRVAVRFVLTMFIFCTLISYTGSIAVNAGISSEKHDLIEALYPVLNDDDQREAVFNVIVKPGTYEMKNVSTDTAAYNMVDAINALLTADARINRDTLKTLLQDFYDFMWEICEEFDYIIFDTPPVGVVTDAAQLASFMDGVILVLESGSIEIEAAQRAKALLSNVKANILGVVLNKIEAKANDYYKYYYAEEEETKTNKKKVRHIGDRGKAVNYD